MPSFLISNDYLIISRLLSFFSTSYSSNGRLKLMQTLDNTSNICTSMSKRIQHQLKCRYLVSRLLSAALQKQVSLHHDGGLYFMIIFCYCLLLFRDLPIDVNKQNLLFQSCLNLINEIHIPHETITLNSIHQLVSIVRAVICKPLAYNDSDLTREQLCILSVKSFLENITLIGTAKQQLILTIEGVPVENSALFNGLLYQISTPNLSLCSENRRTCLYFTVSLAGDYLIEDLDHIETDKQMFEWIQNVAERISTQIIQYTRLHHGGLVLCQKVIHPTVKVKLREYGIDTIDRLGRQYTPYFCYLTGCQPIETLTFATLSEHYFGTVAEIKAINIENKHFLQFVNPANPFHTLVLSSSTEQTLIELKECITASHHVLTNVLLTKQVLYGGGCAESQQILSLKTRTYDLSVNYFLKIFQKIIRAQCNDNQWMIDRIHGHLWYLLENDDISNTCACELYSKTDRLQIESTKYFFFLDDDKHEEKIICENDELFIRNICAKLYFCLPFIMAQKVSERVVTQSGDIPSARSSHSVTAIDHYLYLFGGEHDPRVPIDNDVWQFNTNDNGWKRLSSAKGEPPSSRLAHGAAAIGHTLYIFGGRTSVNMENDTLDDLYSYDIDLHEWIQYRKASDSDPWPAKRSYHAMISIADRFYVFGGCGVVGRYNDLWQYDTTSKQWTQLLTPDSERFVARGGCGMVCVNNTLWVFGGFCGHELDDIARFDLATQTWTYITDAKISPRSVFAFDCLGDIIIAHGGEQNPSQLGHAGAGEFADDVVIICPAKAKGEQVQAKRLELGKIAGGKRGWHAGATIKNTFYVFGGNTTENERDNTLLAIEFE